MESFYRDKAVLFDKVHLSRTYLIVDIESKPVNILAYFTLTFKEIDIDNSKGTISKEFIKKLDGLNKNATEVRSFLIGQIGKNYSIENNPVDLSIIMEYIYCVLKEVNARIGGRVILLECQNLQKLITHYEKQGFKCLPKGEDKLVQMVKTIEF